MTALLVPSLPAARGDSSATAGHCVQLVNVRGKYPIPWNTNSSCRQLLQRAELVTAVIAEETASEPRVSRRDRHGRANRRMVPNHAIEVRLCVNACFRRLSGWNRREDQRAVCAPRTNAPE